MAYAGRYIFSLPFVLAILPLIKTKAGISLFQLFRLWGLFRVLKSSGRFNFNNFKNQEYNHIIEKEFDLNKGLLKNYYDNFDNQSHKSDNFNLNIKIDLFDKIENNKISLYLIMKHPIFFLKFFSTLIFYFIFPNYTLSYISFVYNPYKFIKNLFNQMKMLMRDNF